MAWKTANRRKWGKIMENQMEKSPKLDRRKKLQKDF